MGLSNHLHDVSSDSLPLLFVAAAAGCVAYLRSLVIFLAHSLRLPRLPRCSPLPADNLSAFPSFRFSPSSGCRQTCVVCLSRLSAGERVRRLGCRHVFHAECLDGWFGQMMNLSCPLCRAPLVPTAQAPELRADAQRRVEAELVPWRSNF
ncbi:putative E3 ubiquitin-protein ligase RHA2B [Apostasia shenzhenica]|uniref:Putative E3 ubiquitin-protein ligase RHA2B n=1 Tax=Apostasia shenzhenica TaxID=1088818 RepID=A0A2I0AHW2_9ASPA|nr:putative E3 ubiquitin-protein ligase RHA2B [Apostasia shenzhenica]